MAGEMNAKVRLVRCPRCRLVLPELPEIPVYKCGGCGTVLQAKRQKPDTKDTELCYGDTCESRKVEPVNASEEKEIGHSNQECNISPEEELSADKSPSRSDLGDDNIKQAGDKSMFAGLPVSSELSCENENLSPKFHEQMEQGETRGTLSQVIEEGKTEFCDGYSEWQGGRSSCDDYPSSTELTYHETEDSSPEPQVHTTLDKVKSSSDECTKVNRIDNGNCKSKQDESDNFLCKTPLMIEDEPQESDSYLKCGELGSEFESLQLQQQDNTTSECRVPENANSSGETSSPEVTYEPKKLLPVAEAHAERNTHVNGHIFECLKAEHILNSVELDSTVVSESPLSEYISSDNVLSSDTQHLEPSQKIIPQYFDRTSSSESLDNLLLTNAVSKLGLRQTDLTESSMARSYYSCDGSISSYDGIEDQNPGWFSKPPRRKFKHSVLVNPDGAYKQDESRVKDSLGSEAEMNYPGFLGAGVDDMLSSQYEIRQQARRANYTKHNQYGEPDPRGFCHSGVRRGDQEELAPRIPPISRYSLTGQKNRSRSSYHYSGLQNYSGFCLPDAPSYAESDKMELLRMVYELKDQLNRTRLSNSRHPAGFAWEKTHTPPFYGHLTPPGEMHTDLHQPRYPGRCNQVKGTPHLHKMSRIPFSGVSAQCRREVDCTCMYCHPQDWHCSAQLPSHATCCNSNFHSMKHSSQSFYKGHYSTSSSPQNYSGSQYSAGVCETNSISQRQHNAMTRLRMREMYHSPKRHLRPVAGGIPIIACFHCSELLQLPADFLLLGRRCHQLRCSSCRKIMKFTLQNGRCLAPYLADTIAPPPSMVDDCCDSIDGRDLVSSSHSNKCPNPELHSCSDYYGLSFDRTCSTEWEPSQNIAPSDSYRSHIQNKNRSSVRPLEPSKDSKMKGVLVDSQMTQKKSMEKFGAAGPSAMVLKSGTSTSEIEELPPTSGSPLHRLMGYSSPSQVIKL